MHNGVKKHYTIFVKVKESIAVYKRTLDIRRLLDADNMLSLLTWVDASYTVHDDMKSHMSGCISFGVGILMTKYSKQKLNTKSITESEIVGANDYIPNVIWIELFLKHQGIVLQKNDFGLDSQSVMKLEMNGKISRGPGSRNIDIRYFFMKHRLDTKNTNVVYCPTGEMLADFYTKPLQGKLF